MENNVIKKLERERILWLICLIISFFIVLGIITAIIFLPRYHNNATLAVLLIFSYIILFSFACFKFENDVKSGILNNIIKNIVQDRGNIRWERSFSHLPNSFRNGHYGEERGLIGFFIGNNATTDNFLNYFAGFRRLGFCNGRGRPNVRHGDIFHGIYDNNNFIASEVKISETIIRPRQFYNNMLYGRRRRYYGNSNYTRRKIFNGFIIEIEVDKIFTSHLMIRGHQWFFNLPGFVKADLEPTPFSKKFDVFINGYSSDITIPPMLPKYIMNFDRDTSIALVDNRIVFMFKTGKNMFKLGSLFRKVDNNTQYKKFLDDFTFMLSIIRNLPKVINNEEI